MCELLGMSANVPTDICFSFSGLIRRGGDRGPHKDGWGVTFYEGKGSRTFCDPEGAANSKIAQFIQSYPIKSRIVISHIRRANRGRVCLENTHPFTRELEGQNWTFAHNGQLKGIKKRVLQFYRPLGTTDSEHAFCWLLDHIRKHFGSRPKKRTQYIQVIVSLLHNLSQQGRFNVLVSDGKFLYAFCSSQMHWITRRAPFGKARLIDDDIQIDFKKETTAKDVVTVVATRPLTVNEKWQKMEKGELIIFKSGERIYNKKLIGEEQNG